MDFAEMLLSRFDGETGIRKPSNVLICFSDLETGKILNRLAIDVIRSTKAEKSAITLFYFIDKAEERRHSEEMDEYRQRISTDFISAEEKDKITLRLFIQPLGDYHAGITNIPEEQKPDLILSGISNRRFNPALARRYNQLKNDPAHSEHFIQQQFREEETETLKGINALFLQNRVPTGLFIDGGATEFRKIFVPILDKADVDIFTYLIPIAQQENVKMMIWDAIGIIQSDPKMQKLYHAIGKKTEGRIYLWDDNRKIETDFIKEQDLVIVGTEGWSKLISTPLQWTDLLPSILIIKEKTNSTPL